MANYLIRRLIASLLFTTTIASGIQGVDQPVTGQNADKIRSSHPPTADMDGGTEFINRDLDASCPSDYKDSWSVFSDLRIDQSTRMVILSRVATWFITEDEDGNIISKLRTRSNETLLGFTDHGPSSALYQGFKDVTRTEDGQKRELYLFSRVIPNTVRVYVQEPVSPRGISSSFSSRGRSSAMAQVPVAFQFNREVETSALTGISDFATSNELFVIASVAVDHLVPSGSSKYQYLLVTNQRPKEENTHYHLFNSNFDRITRVSREEPSSDVTSRGPSSDFTSRGPSSGFTSRGASSAVGGFSDNNTYISLPDSLSLIGSTGSNELMFRIFWGRYLFKEDSLPANDVSVISLSVEDGPSRWKWSLSRIGCPPHLFFDASMDAFTRMHYPDLSRSAQLLFKGSNYWRLNLNPYEYPCWQQMKQGDACISLIPADENQRRVFGPKVDAAITLQHSTLDGVGIDEYIGLIIGSEVKIIQNQKKNFIHLDVSTDPSSISIAPLLPREWLGRIDAAFALWIEESEANLVVLIKNDGLVTVKAFIKPGDSIWSFEALNTIPRFIFDYFNKIPAAPDAGDFDPSSSTYQFFYDNHYVTVKKSDAKFSPTDEIKGAKPAPFGEAKGTTTSSGSQEHKANTSVQNLRIKRALHDYEEEVIEYEDDGRYNQVLSDPSDPFSLHIHPVGSAVFSGGSYSDDDEVILPPPLLNNPSNMDSRGDPSASGAGREVKLIQGNLFQIEEAFYADFFGPRASPIKSYLDFATWRNKYKHPHLDNPLQPDRESVSAPRTGDGKKGSSGDIDWVKWTFIAAVVLLILFILLSIIFCMLKKKRKKKEKDEDTETSSAPPSGTEITGRDVEKLSSKDLSRISPSSHQPGLVGGAKSDVGGAGAKTGGAKVSPTDSDATYGKSVPAMEIKTPSIAKSSSTPSSGSPTGGRTFGHKTAPPSKEAIEILHKIDHKSPPEEKKRSLCPLSRKGASVPPSASCAVAVSYPSTGAGNNSAGTLSSPGV